MACQERKYADSLFRFSFGKANPRRICWLPPSPIKSKICTVIITVQDGAELQATFGSVISANSSRILHAGTTHAKSSFRYAQSLVSLARPPDSAKMSSVPSNDPQLIPRSRISVNRGADAPLQQCWDSK